MPKLLNIFLILIAFFILIALARQITEAMQAGKRLDKSVEEVSLLQEQNKSLQIKLRKVQSPDHIEEIARDKMNMARLGETVVIIPKEALDRVLGTNSKNNGEENLPYWQGWLRLFFH
jgi:cell division protein FtsB